MDTFLAALVSGVVVAKEIYGYAVGHKDRRESDKVEGLRQAVLFDVKGSPHVHDDVRSNVGGSRKQTLLELRSKFHRG